MRYKRKRQHVLVGRKFYLWLDVVARSICCVVVQTQLVSLFIKKRHGQLSVLSWSWMRAAHTLGKVLFSCIHFEPRQVKIVVPLKEKAQKRNVLPNSGLMSVSLLMWNAKTETNFGLVKGRRRITRYYDLWPDVWISFLVCEKKPPPKRERKWKQVVSFFFHKISFQMSKISWAGGDVCLAIKHPPSKVTLFFF